MANRGPRLYVTMLILVAVGLLAACSVLVERHAMESGNRTAIMLSDYRSLSDYARQQGLDLDEVLSKVKGLGVTALAVDELNRDDFQNNGLARLVNSYELADLQFQGRVSNSFTPNAKCVYMVAANADIAANIVAYGTESLGEKRVSLVDAAHHVVALEGDMRQIGVMGFGIPMDTVDKLVNKYGFRVWVRPWNSPSFKPENLHRVIQSWVKPGIDGVIFGGLRNEVLGFPNHLDMVGEEIYKAHLKIGVIELPRQAQQKGIETLARQHPQNVVRVLSVSNAQQIKMHPQAVAAMYCLGARERNIRLLYVRPYADGFDKLSVTESSELLFSTICRDLQGYLGKEASVFTNIPNTGRGLSGFNFRLLFIALGIASAWGALLRTTVGWSSRGNMLILGLALLVTGGTILTGIGLVHWRLALGLLALMVFPTWGMVLLFPVMERCADSSSLNRAICAGIKIVLIAAGFSLVGGIMGASCLPDVTYMLSVDVFRGVKMHSMMVPFLVILFWIIFQNRRGAFKRVRQILNREVRVWHLAVFVFLAGVFAFYLIRTGNSGGDLVVSDSERELRRWLDMVLGVRPRFKEFVLGNPILLCIPTFIMCRWRGFVPFAVLAAAVGEASIAGTYAHLHTPITVSLWRSVIGVLAGIGLGCALSIAVFVVHRLCHRYVLPWLQSLEEGYGDSSEG